jgi:anti-anti-sigma factor
MSVVTWAATRGPIGVTEGAAVDVGTNLILDARVEGDTAFVTCYGRIAQGATARRFRACIGSLLRRYRRVVLDLGAVAHIDARGVGMLARLVAQAKSADRRLILGKSSDRVERILRLTRLDVELTPTPSAIGVALRPKPMRTVDSSSQLLCPFRAGRALTRQR